MGMLLVRHKHEKPSAASTKVVTEAPVSEPHTYSRSEITLMPVDGLKKVASELGVEGYADMSGKKLKEILIAKLGL